MSDHTIVIILVLKIFFGTVFPCILATSSYYLLLLLGPYYFCPLSSPSVWNVPLVSLILLKRSVVFPILLFSSVSLHWLLRKALLSLLAILWNSAFRCLYLSFLLCFSLLFFSQLFVRPPQTAFLHFFSMGMVLFPISGTMSRTYVHSSSGTLSIRSSPLNLFLTSTV